MRCLVDPELNRGETDLFHHIYRRAAETLPKVGHLPPAAFFHTGPRVSLPGLKPGQIAAMQLDMPGHEAGKDVLAQVIREFARLADASLTILLLESWMIKPNAEEAEYIKEHGKFLVRPSQHPDRIEIVLTSVSKPGGHNWSAWVEIQRDGNGAPSIALDPPALEYLKSEGRFANILDGAGSQSSLS
jgi:hypothetical protein